MCGDGRDDDDPEGIPSQDCKTYCGYDCTEEIQRGMGVGLGGRGNGSDSALDYKIVHVEFVGKIVKYVAGRSIKELCTGAERIEVSIRFLRW